MGADAGLPFPALPLRWVWYVTSDQSLPPPGLISSAMNKGKVQRMGGGGTRTRFILFLKSLHSAAPIPPRHCSCAGLGEHIHHRQRSIPDPVGLIRKKAGSRELFLLPRQSGEAGSSNGSISQGGAAQPCHPAPLLALVCSHERMSSHRLTGQCRNLSMARSLQDSFHRSNLLLAACS